MISNVSRTPGAVPRGRIVEGQVAHDARGCWNPGPLTRRGVASMAGHRRRDREAPAQADRMIPLVVIERLERAVAELLEASAVLVQVCDAGATTSNGPGTVDAARGLDTGGTPPMTLASYGATAPGLADENVLTVRQAAEFVSVHPNTIYAAVSRGDLACIRIGRTGRGIRLRRAALLAWSPS